MAAKTKEFPLLQTERLRLRQPGVEDAVAFHQLLSIPEITRYSNWPDAPAKARTERVTRWMGKVFGTGRGCAWIIEDGGSEAFMGVIRFNEIDKASKWAVIGYELHPDYWGQGFMTEAVRAVAQCGFSEFSLNRIEAWTLPGNAASDRVLEKSGFQYEGTLRQKAWFKNAFHDFRTFGRLAGDRME